MQKNTEALLIFFSVVGAMLIILLILIFINIKTWDIKFFFKVYTDSTEKTINIKNIELDIIPK